MRPNGTLTLSPSCGQNWTQRKDKRRFIFVVRMPCLRALSCTLSLTCLVAQADAKYQSKLEESSRKDKQRRRIAEGNADALTWDLSQAKGTKEVRLKVWARVIARARVGLRQRCGTRQERKREYKTLLNMTTHRQDIDNTDKT